MPVRLNVAAQLVGELRTGTLASAADKSRIETAHLHLQQAIDAGKVVPGIGAADGCHEGPAFWAQGDASLNTADAFQRRFALRRDPIVRKSLHNLWEATLRSIQSSKKESTRLGYEGYRTLFTRVYRVLIDEYDPNDADECIREDWDTVNPGSLARWILWETPDIEENLRAFLDRIK